MNVMKCRWHRHTTIYMSIYYLNPRLEIGSLLSVCGFGLGRIAALIAVVGKHVYVGAVPAQVIRVFGKPQAVLGSYHPFGYPVGNNRPLHYASPR